MSAPTKLTAQAELENIEDALIEAILNASEEELRQELKEAGGDPDVLIAAIDSAAGRALATARARFWKPRAPIWLHGGQRAAPERSTALPRAPALSRFVPAILISLQR